MHTFSFWTENYIEKIYLIVPYLADLGGGKEPYILFQNNLDYIKVLEPISYI